MSDVFREIQEDLRLERYRALARRFWPYALAAVILGLVSIGGHAIWDNARTARQIAEADRYADAIEALREGRGGEAIADLASLAREARQGYAVLSRLTEATALAVGGDISGAVAVYDLIIADEGVPAHYRDLSRILAANLLLDQGPTSGIQRRLGDLVEGSSSWRHLAWEIEAHLADRDNDMTLARERFQTLADDDEAPPGVRARAREMLSLYGEADS